jgi:hypothetical protein
MVWCPVCATEVPDAELTAIRRVYVDSVWRVYRRHRRCGTAIGLPLRVGSRMGA